MDIIDDNNESAREEGKVDGESGCGNGLPKASTLEEVWEGYGCILWDLAASQTHAELMVPVIASYFFKCYLVYFDILFASI